MQSEEAFSGCDLLLVRGILVFACAVLRFTHRKTLACWLLFIFPAALSLGLFLDLAHGVAN